MHCHVLVLHSVDVGLLGLGLGVTMIEVKINKPLTLMPISLEVIAHAAVRQGG